MESYPIYPYVGVGDLKFGMHRAAVHALLGPPIRQKKSRFSDEVTDFWNGNGLQLVFSSPQGKLLEISLYPNLNDVTLDGAEILSAPGRRVYDQLCKADGSSRQTVGVTVLLKLGIAITGFLNDDSDDKSVTAFALGRWSESDPTLEPVKVT